MHLNKLIVILLIATGIASCSLGPVKNEVPVARAYDKYLYKSDLKKIVPVTASAEDSTRIVDKYIAKWLHENVLISQAELNLSGNQLDFEKKMEQYKNSLIVYSYEQALIDEKLDTNIALLSTVNYYNNHREIFLLKQPAFRMRYIKVNNDAPELTQVLKWLPSDEEEDIEELHLYCENNAIKYFLNDTIWVAPKDIKEEFPENANQVVSELNEGVKNWSDEHFTYLIFIKEKLGPGEQAPVDLVKDDIRSMILNKRKIELLKKMRKDIYTEAVRKKNVELFHN